MNKTKIDWADRTWNPVTGCLHGCEYCYARKIANRFGGASETHYNECVGEECQWCTEETGVIHDLTEPIYDVDRGHKAPYPFGFDPTFHKYRLSEPQQVKKPSKIFVCSMADLFGEWVPDSWIDEVFEACDKAPQHQYLFLTKNPDRYWHYEDRQPNNFWFGATTGDNFKDRTVYNGDGSFICSHMHCVSDHMGFFKNSFLSLEPLCCDAGAEINFYGIDWVIIGQQTGPGAVPPKDEWVQSIIDQCRVAGVPVFVKSPLYEKFPIQEWPEGLENN